MPDKASPGIRMHSPGLDVMIGEIVHTRGTVDIAHQAEVGNIERSTATDEPERYVQEMLGTAHRARRQPYVAPPSRLRMQQRGQSFAA